MTLVGLADLDGRSVYHLRGSPVVDILGDYPDVVGVGEVQVDFWIGSDDFLMRQAVLDISHVDGSGSPEKMYVFFGGLAHRKDEV